MFPRSTELARQVLAEFLGSMLLAAVVIGSGIAPSSVPLYVLAQLIGAGVAIGLLRSLYPASQERRRLTLTDPA